MAENSHPASLDDDEITSDTLGSADAKPSDRDALRAGSGRSAGLLDGEDEPSPEVLAAQQAGTQPRRLTAADKLEQAASGRTRTIVRQGGLPTGRRRREKGLAAHNEEAERDRRAAGISGKRVKKKPPAASWKPEPHAGFSEWSKWASEKITARKKDGGHVKDPADWTGPDLLSYFSDLVEGVIERKRPIATGKTRGQARTLVKQVGGQEAKEIVDYVLSDWEGFCRQFELREATPTIGLLIGYAEHIRNALEGQLTSAGKPGGSDRGADVDWDSLEEEERRR